MLNPETQQIQYNSLSSVLMYLFCCLKYDFTVYPANMPHVMKLSSCSMVF